MTLKKIVASIPFLALLALIILVAFQPALIHSYDQTISHFIQSFRQPPLTQSVKFYTQLGNPTFFASLSVIIWIILLILRKFKDSFFFITSVLLGTGVNHLIKQLISRPRPALKLIEIGGYSFPSGHSVAAMVGFGSLIIIITRSYLPVWLKLSLNLILSLALVSLALSRIYLNVHYPTDVTAGLLLGIVVLQVMDWISYRKLVKKDVS